MIGRSVLALVLGVVGCDGSSVDPPSDGGAIVIPDAELVVDAGVPDAGPSGCTSNGDCEDGNRCTENTCLEGTCWNRSLGAGCAECATDAACDDGFPCTIDLCFGGLCNYEWSSADCECAEDVHCDDFDPATTDRCASYHCEHERRTCTSDAECGDGIECTHDYCDSGVCANERTIACDVSCPDNDGDGYGSRWCFGGTDCDDVSPAIHPGAPEVCSDRIDNDCDGHIDAIDADCSTGGGTCDAARTMTPGASLDGAIRWDSSTGRGTTACGASNFFTIVLADTSDVDVTVTLHEPPPPAPVPGCPECTPDSNWEYWFRLFFERTCGDTTTDLGGGGSWCRTWSESGFAGGTGTETIRLRRVPAGTYTIELQASDFHAWMPIAIEYSISATVTPSAAPMCGSVSVLGEGATVRGTTAGGVNAFGTDCGGAVVDSPEAMHTFTLVEPRRVRVEAIGVPDPISGYVPGLRLALHGACDPASTRLDCLEHTGGDCHPRATMEKVLAAGTYWLVVEGSSGAASYDLTLSTEAVGATCEGAATIAASGSFAGSTTGMLDELRDHRVCGDGYGPDVVYRVEVAAPSRIVLDLIASYEGAMLTLYRGCAEARVAGGRSSTRVDVTLDPGSYVAVVGGQREANAGSYVLNATFVPSTP